MKEWMLTFSPFIPWMPGSPLEGNTEAGLGAASTGWMVLSVPPTPAGDEPVCPSAPWHLPCPLWVLRGRVCPGEGKTKREC